jgi:hypothetical protein
MSIVDRASFYLNSSAGNVRLRRVKSCDVSDGRSTEAVNAVGSDAPIGFRDKPGAMSLTLEVYDEPAPEVDYFALKLAREEFDFVIQDDGGKRQQFIPCRVSKIDRSKNDEGEHMLSVEIIALEVKEL